MRNRILIYGSMRENLKLAFPLIAGQLGQVLVNVADNVMVGQLGTVELASVSFAIAYFAVFYVMGMGISFALPPLIAEAYGKKNEKAISRDFKHSLVLNTVYAGVIILLFESTTGLLFFLGQDEAVVHTGMPYLRLIIYSILPYMIFQAIRSVSDGVGITKLAMVALLAGNLLNILLNYVLIFGKMGFPEMGVKGAGLSSLISRVFMIGLLLLLMAKRKNMMDYLKGVKGIRFEKKRFSKLFHLGLPTSLQMLFEVSIFSGSAFLMGKLGAVQQAAHQIALNLITVSFMACTGVAIASTILVGQHYGAGKMRRVRRAGFAGISMSAGFMFLSGIFFLLARNFLPTLYISEEEVIQFAAVLLVVAAFFQIPDGIQVTAIGALRGIQDVQRPSVYTFIAYVIIGLPACYILGFVVNWGYIGIWSGLLIGLSLSAFLNTRRFHLLTDSKANHLIAPIEE